MSYFKKSPWIIHYDGSSCNGCDIETLACLTPVYDIERLGVVNTGNPKHADVLLATGGVNEESKRALRNIYDQMPDPKVVVAIGICATSAGIFSDCYNIKGGVDKVIPVDVYVPGCAARPELIIDGIREALLVLEEKKKQLSGMVSGLHKISISEAGTEEAGEILFLQRLAFRSEAEIYDDFSIAPLKQTLEELKDDFRAKVFLKAVMNGKIIGAVRAQMAGETCCIDRLIVDPLYQHHGVGKRMMREIEKRFSAAKRYQVHTGYKSKRNIVFYQNLGYQLTRPQKAADNQERVYLEKAAAGEKE